jgi:hypothetical protein
VSLSNVGSNAVVPNRRCAATMAAMPAGLGSSLKRTSPPPFTWLSIKPGASHPPFGRMRVGMVAGNSLLRTMLAIREPSITTAQPWRTVVPSKTVSAATACRRRFAATRSLRIDTRKLNATER